MRYALLPLSTVLALSTWVAAESAPAFAVRSSPIGFRHVGTFS
jgi:hypothetical protein